MRLPVGFKNIKEKKKTHIKTPAEIIPPLFLFPVQSVLHNSSLSGWQIGTGEARSCSDAAEEFRAVLGQMAQSPLWGDSANSAPGGLCALGPPCLVCAEAQMSSPRPAFLPRDRYNKAGESLHSAISFHGSKIKAENTQ